MRGEYTKPKPNLKGKDINDRQRQKFDFQGIFIEN